MEPEYTSLRILFVRHGETQHNKTKTLAGQQPGKLTNTGRYQAQMIGKYFQTIKSKFDYIYISDLGRTQ